MFHVLRPRTFDNLESFGWAEPLLVLLARVEVERLGAKVRVWQTTYGAQPMSIGYVIEHASWAEFGNFGEKMERDTEWESFWRDALAHPSADLIQNSVVSEPPGL